MKTKETVTTQGKVGYDKSFHLESLESDTAIIENLHSPNDIDGGAFTFIQLKNLSSYQYIIVHGDFDTDSNSNILKDVRKLIKRTTRNFSFWFPATDIADSVFSRPFVWN
ncbi:MAG: hypothetical protein EOP48_23685 [Sphingobacteriales bacterium]|nr:MAG: hypothetical protein EOP48_23685 [Sphingobacteriales bacterium]